MEFSICFIHYPLDFDFRFSGKKSPDGNFSQTTKILNFSFFITALAYVVCGKVMFSDLFFCQSVFPTLSHNIQGKGSHVTYPMMHLMLPVYKQLQTSHTDGCGCLESKQVTSSASMGKVTWDPSPLPEYYGIELERLTDRQTGLKTLLSHKLCMWVVIKKLKFKILFCEKLLSGDVFFPENPKSKCGG